MTRTPTVFVAFVVLCGCGRAAPADELATQSKPAFAPSAGETVRGTVAEKIDASQYSYLRLKTSSGESWAAVPKTDTPVGAAVAVVGAIWMEDFKSSSLGRTWDRVAFGTLEGTTHGPIARGTKELPAGHPPVSAPADVPRVKVTKAPGPEGRTIAEVWSGMVKLKDRKVAVRGQVVKATNGVLGKNWLHLRDGTGAGDTADLAVTSTDAAAVGTTVLVTGTVRLERDLGAGYRYALILEDAQVEIE